MPPGVLLLVEMRSDRVAKLPIYFLQGETLSLRESSPDHHNINGGMGYEQQIELPPKATGPTPTYNMVLKNVPTIDQPIPSNLTWLGKISAQ